MGIPAYLTLIVMRSFDGHHIIYYISWYNTNDSSYETFVTDMNYIVSCSFTATPCVGAVWLVLGDLDCSWVRHQGDYLTVPPGSDHHGEPKTPEHIGDNRSLCTAGYAAKSRPPLDVPRLPQRADWWSFDSKRASIRFIGTSYPVCK